MQIVAAELAYVELRMHTLSLGFPIISDTGSGTTTVP
jgi:hypothetical protein